MCRAVLGGLPYIGNEACAVVVVVVRVVDAGIGSEYIGCIREALGDAMPKKEGLV